MVPVAQHFPEPRQPNRKGCGKRKDIDMGVLNVAPPPQAHPNDTGGQMLSALAQLLLKSRLESGLEEDKLKRLTEQRNQEQQQSGEGLAGLMGIEKNIPGTATPDMSLPETIRRPADQMEPVANPLYNMIIKQPKEVSEYGAKQYLEAQAKNKFAKPDAKTLADQAYGRLRSNLYSGQEEKNLLQNQLFGDRVALDEYLKNNEKTAEAQGRAEYSRIAGDPNQKENAGYLSSYLLGSNPDLNKTTQTQTMVDGKPMTVSYNQLNQKVGDRGQAVSRVTALGKVPVAGVPGIFLDKTGDVPRYIDTQGNEHSTEEVQRMAVNFKEDMPTEGTKNRQQIAPKVLNFISRIRPLLTEDNVGPITGRWNDFWQGKIGAPNKQMAQLKTELGLLETALMNMHVGARGGIDMMNHFKELIGEAKQSPENMRSAMDSIESYANDVKSGWHGEKAIPQNVSGSSQGTASSGQKTKTWNPSKKVFE